MEVASSSDAHQRAAFLKPVDSFEAPSDNRISFFTVIVPVPDFIRVFHSEPHAGRGRQLLLAHPELRALAGPDRRSALWVVALVLLQGAAAIVLGEYRWYVWFPCAYIIGATIDHALWVLIHECSHNLIVRSRTGNRLIAIVANLPMVVPAALSFCKYHLLHHRHLGEMDLDAGVPGPVESRIVGRSGVLKTLWISFFVFIMGIVRPRRIRVKLLDGWTVLNIVVQIATTLGFITLFGATPFFYLLASSLFAIGLHPLGARWVQEHFALREDQETYSYYGPLNKVSFNVGYHNEHHDLVTVPWSRLPEIRRGAPEFYENLSSYSSWTGLLVRFLADRSITLFSYIVRPAPGESTARPASRS
jgi:sphingolipid delta-4 desaturase